VNEICAKTFWEGTFLCAPSFLVCARLTTCVRAHSLEVTLTRHSVSLFYPGSVLNHWYLEDGSSSLGLSFTAGAEHTIPP